MSEFQEKAKNSGNVAMTTGAVERVPAAAHTLVAEYEFPYLAHACTWNR